MPEIRNIGTLFREMDAVKRELKSIAMDHGDALDSLFLRIEELEAEIAKLRDAYPCTESDPDEGFTHNTD